MFLVRYTELKIAKIFKVFGLVGLCLSIYSLSAFSQNANTKNSDKTNQKLNEIQQAISQQKQALTTTNIKISDLEQQLKTDDIAIGRIAKSLQKTTTELNVSKNKVAKLAVEKQQLETDKKQQEQILAKQLRAAYSTGHHDYLKLILNQENPASVQRTITHYQYLNKARINEIETFKVTITKLEEVTRQQQQQTLQLTQLTQ